jgi:hypothetical protein
MTVVSMVVTFRLWSFSDFLFFFVLHASEIGLVEVAETNKALVWKDWWTRPRGCPQTKLDRVYA